MPPASTPEISQVLTLLHQWGIHTLGELAALDREQLRLRLGPIAARLWDQASGKSTRLLRLVRPTEIFAEEIEFEYEIETTEPLLFILRRFLEQLERRLALYYLVAADLTFQLTFADKSRYEHRFQIPDPTNSVEILFRLLQSHLENFRAEYPIVAVALALQPARAARQQFDLFETPLRDPSRLQETLTRLTGLLGAERVGTPVLEDSHRPDAFQLAPFSWQLPLSPNESSEIIGPALRRFRSASYSLGAKAVLAREGPYLASGNWWDGKKWESAEWDVELEDRTLQRSAEDPHGAIALGVYD